MKLMCICRRSFDLHGQKVAFVRKARDGCSCTEAEIGESSTIGCANLEQVLPTDSVVVSVVRLARNVGALVGFLVSTSVDSKGQSLLGEYKTRVSATGAIEGSHF
jgi:hypothetical protein